MKKTVFIILLGLLSVASISSITSFAGRDGRSTVYSGSQDQGSDDDSSDDRDGNSYDTWIEPRADVQASQNNQYVDECGSCHFAYQPGLLPASSWARIMGALENHFDDDASLATQQTTEIRNYLLTNSADQASSSRSRAFASGTLAGDALPRITATTYFRREHSEIPSRFVRDNPDVASFSNCQACHRNADKGSFNEHQVFIPGVGRWDD